MITKINGEQAFQILASSFVVSPSAEGYSLEVSADGFSFSPLFKVAPNFVKMVTNVVNGAFYRCKGNASSLTINWSKENNAQPTEESVISVASELPEQPTVGQTIILKKEETSKKTVDDAYGYYVEIPSDTDNESFCTLFQYGNISFSAKYNNGNREILEYVEISGKRCDYEFEKWVYIPASETGLKDAYYYVWSRNQFIFKVSDDMDKITVNPYDGGVWVSGEIPVVDIPTGYDIVTNTYVCVKEATQGGDKEYVDSFESGVKEFGVEMDWTAWDYGFASFGDYFGWNGFQAGRENEGETPDENRTFVARYFAGGDWANFIKFESRPEEGASGSFDTGFVGNNWQAVGNWSFNNNILTVNFNLVQGAFGYTRSEDPYSKEKVFIFTPDTPAEWSAMGASEVDGGGELILDIDVATTEEKAAFAQKMIDELSNCPEPWLKEKYLGKYILKGYVAKEEDGYSISKYIMLPVNYWDGEYFTAYDMINYSGNIWEDTKSGVSLWNCRLVLYPNGDSFGDTRLVK